VSNINQTFLTARKPTHLKFWRNLQLLKKLQFFYILINFFRNFSFFYFRTKYHIKYCDFDMSANKLSLIYEKLPISRKMTVNEALSCSKQDKAHQKILEFWKFRELLARQSLAKDCNISMIQAWSLYWTIYVRSYNVRNKKNIFCRNLCIYWNLPDLLDHENLYSEKFLFGCGKVIIPFWLWNLYGLIITQF